jgi:hypothetical protein
MRTNWHVSTLALSSALVLAACGTRQPESATISDDLKSDLAVASAPASDLAIASPSYQRMRFVSAAEQTPAAAPAKRPSAARKVTHTASRHKTTTSVATTSAVAPEPMAEMEHETPSPVAASETAEQEAPTVIVQSAPAPSSEPAREPASTSDGVGRGHGGGLGGIGGILGGIIGSVVIRGGAGGIDHCDPRHDGRARPTVGGRPDFGMPVYQGRVLGGVRRR